MGLTTGVYWCEVYVDSTCHLMSGFTNANNPPVETIRERRG